MAGGGVLIRAESGREVAIGRQIVQAVEAVGDTALDAARGDIVAGGGVLVGAEDGGEVGVSRQIVQAAEAVGDAALGAARVDVVACAGVSSVPKTAARSAWVAR